MPRSNSRSTIVAVLFVAGAAALAAQQPSAAAKSSAAIRIPFERFTLANGLDVILAPDHSTPQVTVDIWYHVGSKNEVPGHTGFAHMFEHVMFTGSLNVPYGLHDRLTEGVSGVANNGSTSNDRTNYYETVPPNYLESVLWIESDRMGFLLDKLDSAKFVAQRDIVQNERRQGVDNQPYGRSFEILTTAIYPESNPYSWPVVGYLNELQQASVEDVKNFFRLYYAPSNATMSIVGDFEPAQVKALVTKYFAGLPKGKPISRPTVAAHALGGEKRLVFEDRVQVPRLYLQWLGVSAADPDNAALSYLAQVLSASRTARLDKELVYDKQLATNVNAFSNAQEKSGTLTISITPRPGHTLTEIEETTDSIIARLKREGPRPDELAKARANVEFGFVAGLESALGKAETLNNGLVFHGNPGWFKEQYTSLTTVTADDVKRVANKYLGPNRVVLSVVPLNGGDQASKASESTKVTVSADGGHYIMGSK